MKKEKNPAPLSSAPISRREMLIRSAGLMAAGTAAFAGAAQARSRYSERAVESGRIRQSIVHWCFELSDQKWSLDQTCQAAKKLGVESVELLTPDQLPTLAR